MEIEILKGASAYFAKEKGLSVALCKCLGPLPAAMTITRAGAGTGGGTPRRRWVLRRQLAGHGLRCIRRWPHTTATLCIQIALAVVAVLTWPNALALGGFTVIGLAVTYVSAREKRSNGRSLPHEKRR